MAWTSSDTFWVSGSLSFSGIVKGLSPLREAVATRAVASARTAMPIVRRFFMGSTPLSSRILVGQGLVDPPNQRVRSEGLLEELRARVEHAVVARSRRRCSRT